MNLRFAALIAGCMLAGAAVAGYHRAENRTTAAALAGAAELPPPLFLQAATGAPTTAAWPPNTSVAFYAEMFEQLRAATAPQPRPQAPQLAARDGAPQRPGVAPAQADNDTVEIVIRDRFGRPLRVERIDRRLLAPAGGYLTPPPHVRRPHPHAPYGAYGPYR